MPDAQELGGASREAGAVVSFDHQIQKGNMPKKKTANLAAKLTEGEQDLLTQMENGYQLETNSLGSDLVLRRLKDGELIRPLSANASTVKALQESNLIHPAKGRDPLTIVWHLNKKQK